MKTLIFTGFFVLWKISFEIELFVVMIIIIINQTKRMPHLWNWLIFSHFNQSDLVILLKTMRGSQDSTCIQSIRMYNILVISVKTCCIMSECHYHHHNYEVSSVAFTSQLFFELRRKRLLFAKMVVMLDTGIK